EGSSGLRGPALRTERSRWREELLGKWISAIHLSRRGIPPFGRSCAVPLEPRGHEQRDAAAFSGLIEDAQHGASSGCRRSGDRIAHPVLRDGVQDAIQRARSFEYRERTCRSPQNVRYAAGTELLREQLSARAEAGGAGRTDGSALPSRLGHPRLVEQ